VPETPASDGVALYYETWGKPISGEQGGEPVLFVMGLGADRRGWLFQRMAFGRRYRCITLDNRGVGDSGKPQWNPDQAAPGEVSPYNLEQMARDAVTVLDAVGVDSAHIVGVSMGGVIAQIMAVRHPSRVRSLTLASTACRHHEWRRELLAEWEEIARTQGMGALGGKAFRWLINPRIRKRFGMWLDILARIVMSQPSEGFANQARAILDMPDDVRDELHTVRVPTLVIVGSQDILTPVGDSEELAETIEGAELVVIGGAAHGVNAEAPAKWNDHVLTFLERVTNPSSAEDAAEEPGAAASA